MRTDACRNEPPGIDLLVALELIGSLKNRAAWLGQIDASPSLTASLRACFNALGLSVHMPHGPLQEKTGSASTTRMGWLLCVRDREKLRLEAWRPEGGLEWHVVRYEPGPWEQSVFPTVELAQFLHDYLRLPGPFFEKTFDILVEAARYRETGALMFPAEGLRRLGQAMPGDGEVEIVLTEGKWDTLIEAVAEAASAGGVTASGHGQGRWVTLADTLKRRLYWAAIEEVQGRSIPVVGFFSEELGLIWEALTMAERKCCSETLHETNALASAELVLYDAGDASNADSANDAVEGSRAKARRVRLLAYEIMSRSKERRSEPGFPPVAGSSRLYSRNCSE